jgi:hypothetical protein
MHRRIQRIQRLEAACGLQVPVYAVYLADADAYQVVMGAPRAQLPAALFWERYPTARIVSSFATAAMWDAI